MSKKIKWNYALMKSLFGDLWIGKTKLPPKKEVIFCNLEDAKEKAKNLFLNEHPDFDIEAFENEEEPDNYDNEESYRKIVKCNEKEVEEINKKIEKFIVGSY